MNTHILSTDELNIRFGIVSGIPLWGTQPLYKHQNALDRILASVHSALDRRLCWYACGRCLGVFPQRFGETAPHLHLLPVIGMQMRPDRVKYTP